MAAPISQVGLQTIFPMLKALEKEGADEDFVLWARKLENAKALMVWYYGREGVMSRDRNIIQVPDITSADLLELARVGLGLTSVDGELIKWDFMGDTRGKIFEVKFLDPSVTHPDFRQSCDQVIKDGFRGNPAAFIAWKSKTKAKDNFAIFPDDKSGMRAEHNGESRRLYPLFKHYGGKKWLELSPDVYFSPYRKKNPRGAAYVAFREINP